MEFNILCGRCDRPLRHELTLVGERGVRLTILPCVGCKDDAYNRGYSDSIRYREATRRNDAPKTDVYPIGDQPNPIYDRERERLCESQFERELNAWLDTQAVTSKNIGAIRALLKVPWSSRWNAIVRDQTAARENKPPQSPTTL